MEAHTISAPCEISGAAQGRASSIWRLVSKREEVIVRISKGGKGPAIYCVHSIGGDLSGYDILVNSLNVKNPIFGIQMPRSLMARSSDFSIEALAHRYADLISQNQPTDPLILIGYSAGAVVALELAQEMKRRGRDVPLLVALDGAPSNSGAGLKRWTYQYAIRLLFNIPWRLACVRLSDLSPRKLRMRSSFRRAVSSRQSFLSDDAVEYDAISDVVSRSGWTKEQQKHLRNMCEMMTTYIPKSYTDNVILYEVKAQPFSRLLQYSAIWKSICPTCEIVTLPFTRHSDFFVSRYGLPRIVEHLRAALTRLDKSDENSQDLLGEKQAVSTPLNG